MNKPLKTVLLYNRGHMGSMIVLNKILKMKCYDVSAVVRVNSVDFTAKGCVKLRKNLKKTGFLFALMLLIQTLVQGFVYLLACLLPCFKNRKLSSNELIKKHKIDFHDSEDINSEETLNFLKKQEPDLLISAYFPQILKPEALSVPLKGVLNIHPGLIPEYKGAMAYFWAVKNESAHAGVSVHWMDEGIDTGPLLARKSFKIGPKTSQDKVLIKTAIVGSSLLGRIGKKLQKGKKIKNIDTSNCRQKYYSLPGKKAFSEYCNKNHFFSFRVIFRAIAGKY